MAHRPLRSILGGTILLAVRSPHQLGRLVELFTAWHSRIHVCPPSAYPDVLAFTLSCLPDLVIVSTDWPLADAVKLPDSPKVNPQFSQGYDLCQRLRADPRLASLPIVLLEAPMVPLDRDRAFACGASDYLPHPIVEREVQSRVRDQLRSHRLEKESTRRAAQLRLPLRPPIPLLAEVQKRLRQQATLIQKHNQDLAREVCEREQTEQALRAEKLRSEKLLLSIFPQAIVQRLQEENRSSIAERFDEATILFADIVDFTPLSSRMSAMELVGILNQVFSAFDRLTEYYGLEKIKTIGDEYMVVGGVPTPRPDHAPAIMEMAIAMRKAANRLGRDIGHKLQLRIGINTGPVVAGVIGLQKFSYDLWGDAVNVASRMESHGLPNRIQVTEQTFHKLKDRYKFEKWQNTKVKGKGRMTTYLYVARKADLEQSHRNGGNLTGGNPAAIAPKSYQSVPTQSVPNHPVPNQNSTKPPDGRYLDALGINRNAQTES